MDLKEIMSVSGQGGLFKFVSQARNGIIVESFSDGKRSFVSTSTKVSTLEDIAIFTEEKEVPLKQVFKAILSLEGEINLPDPGSDPDELKVFMAKVLPEYDRNRVYISDIKKVINWYQTLKNHDLLDFSEEDASSETDADAPAGTKAEPETGSKADAKAGIKAAAKSDTKADAKTGAKAGAKADAKTGVKARAKADAKSGTSAGAKSDM